jgi:hypothetical protein
MNSEISSISVELNNSMSPLERWTAEPADNNCYDEYLLSYGIWLGVVQ